MSKRISYGRIRAGEFPELPAVGRGVRIFLGWMCAGLVLMAIYMMTVLMARGQSVLLAFSALVFAPFQILGAVLWIRWSRRVRREVEAHGLRCCPHCLYPIGHLGERGRCPECGREFEMSRVVAEWERYVRLVKGGRIDTSPVEHSETERVAGHG